MPFLKFTAGQVLTASQVNTYLMNQSVMVFADASARTTALTGEVAEGMVSLLLDTGTLWKYDGTQWVGISTSTINEQAGTTYTLVATDAGNTIRTTSSSAVTLTVANVLNIGDRVEVVQSGTGQVTFTAGAGVTLQSYQSELTTAGQHAWAGIICLASGIYGVVGNLV